MFLHERALRIQAWLHGWLFEELVFALAGFIFLIFLAYAFDPQAELDVVMMLIAMSPIWLPLYLGNFFWLTWMHYIRYAFWFKQEYVLLEVQLPPEVEKSPKAMELFLVAIHNSGGEATFISRIWKGSFRPIWSLEIASNEGRLGFYLRVSKGWRNIVEARLYGQFPEAKLLEVEDYVSKIPFNLHEYNLFGAEYTKGNACNALPIKTYIDFGLDKDPDEELKIDPITNTLELLAQVGKDEYFWLQYIVKARKKDEWYGFYSSGPDAFIESGKKEIKNMIKAAAERVGELAGDKAVGAQAISRGPTLLTPYERERMEAIERSMNKPVFEVGVRVVYLAKRDSYAGINAGAIVRFFDAFRGSTNHNSLGVARGSAGYDYPWQDYKEIRQNMERRNMFFRYKHRAFFYVPYDQKPEFMTTEELATLWHFPSSVVKTPGLNRVPSRRAEAPVNLPTLPQ